MCFGESRSGFLLWRRGKDGQSGFRRCRRRGQTAPEPARAAQPRVLQPSPLLLWCLSRPEGPGLPDSSPPSRRSRWSRRACRETRDGSEGGREAGDKREREGGEKTLTEAKWRSSTPASASVLPFVLPKPTSAASPIRNALS